eukprot:TRINITY_DN469_c0_g1_i6.p1 TRINITY_DN469_c0_g1~~TRINITY_DN469_c0_g1_i6.p1  ORF type:complete len:275 (+),score=57.68 TRINITY_DN469_c0_g1_i6:2367-3191(+)
MEAFQGTIIAERRLQAGTELLVKWRDSEDWEKEEDLRAAYPAAVEQWNRDQGNAPRRRSSMRLPQRSQGTEKPTVIGWEQGWSPQKGAAGAEATAFSTDAATDSGAQTMPNWNAGQLSSLGPRKQLTMRYIIKLLELNRRLLTETKSVLRERRETDDYVLSCGEGKGASLMELDLSAAGNGSDFIGDLDTHLEDQVIEDKGLQKRLKRLRALEEQVAQAASERGTSAASGSQEAQELRQQEVEDLRTELAEAQDAVRRLRFVEKKLLSQLRTEP